MASRAHPRRRTAPWTPAELARIEQARVDALALSMATTAERPTDVAAAQAAVAALYRRAGHAPVFTWVVDGPLAAHVAMTIWERTSLGASLDSLRDSLDASLGSLGTSLHASLDASLGTSLHASLRSLGDSLGASLGSLGTSLHASLRSLGDSLGASLDSLGASLRASLRASRRASRRASLGSLDASLRDSLDSLRDSLGASLGSLDASLRASLHASLGANGPRWTWFWGALDWWVSWYRMAADLGVPITAEQDARLGEFEALARAGWWLWPYEHGAVLLARPAVCRMEEAQPGRWRLHAEDGPALAWPDGWAIHAWHGIRVPAAVIEQPGAITAEAIAAEPNAEVRRAMIERIGWERYLTMSQATQIQADDYGTLLQLPGLPEEDEPLVLVRVTNSTPEPDGHHKDYVLRVPPTVTSAREAVAWTFGVARPEDYVPEVQT